MGLVVALSYHVAFTLQASIARGLAYAPYCDLLWMETSTPSLEEAKEFADAIHAKYPGKLLAYNCSPSFNWKRHLNDAQIANYQKVHTSLFGTLKGRVNSSSSLLKVDSGAPIRGFCPRNIAEFIVAPGGSVAWRPRPAGVIVVGGQSRCVWSSVGYQ